MIFVHWFADTLDGPMARARGASDLGHYLDHFGDIVGVVLIGLAAFTTPGSHLVIGVGIVIIFLLSVIHTQIKAELTGVTVIPRFGPTELHLVAMAALIAQVFIEYGEPLFASAVLTGNGGRVPELLGSDSGLTLMDHLGILLLVAGAVGLAAEVGLFLIGLRRSK
jgi:phosphatidylglycerophosphate synthase